MKKLFVALPLLLLAYLFFWPVPYQPAAWTVVPGIEAPLNDELAEAEVIHPELKGPEAIAFDADGGLITGLLDGRLVRIGATVETLYEGKGRTLGVKIAPDGRMWICDVVNGLMVSTDGGFEQVGTGAKVPDDLDFGDDGAVYFSNASQRNDLDHFVDDLVEHQRTGQLLRWRNGQVDIVADDFNFANGVTFGPSREWLILAETGSYRLWKIWVKDGRKEVFAELPGFPDNVTWSGSTFWVAVGSPRNKLIDSMARTPFLRKAIFRLPNALKPKPEKHAIVLGFDAEGKLTHNLQLRGPQAYSPIASVIEHDGALYLGSFRADGYARFALKRRP